MNLNNALFKLDAKSCFTSVRSDNIMWNFDNIMWNFSISYGSLLLAWRLCPSDEKIELRLTRSPHACHLSVQTNEAVREISAHVPITDCALNKLCVTDLLTDYVWKKCFQLNYLDPKALKCPTPDGMQDDPCQ